MLTVLLAGCSARDPIDRLMAELPYQRVSYSYEPIKLPESASPEQLISALSERGYFQDMGVTNYGPLQTRAVHTTPRPADNIPLEYFTAILLNTSGGKRILLLRPERTGWYYKMYDTK